ncbi:hypothetical protein EW146_g6890 [Bondarzewia mesenterica]|uniref:Uncharacterized protein n=1 Tax=Bondarzewia mesenterica TaxID=1095465 RepID=A0A4S4LP58_9AGAM|nr:hypothetical protein EW146_g6890 [Bondarzewia mesenterica]
MSKQDRNPSQKSRILAALDSGVLPEDAGNADTKLSIHDFFLGAGQKRKRDSPAGSRTSTPGPSNKRHASQSHKDRLNQLPSGLLASTQSPDTTVRSEPGGSVIDALSLLTQSSVMALRGDGFQLNYDNESPLSRYDVGGPDQLQRMAEFVSRSIDNLSSGLLVKDGLKYLGMKEFVLFAVLDVLNAKDLLPGLEVRLIPHQIIGVSWMLMQEKETVYNGGIMADDMGLGKPVCTICRAAAYFCACAGKTVQMIATMAMNMPEIDEKHRTTLIVVPAALLHQWKEELEAKTNGVFSVHIHHGKEKLKTLSAMQSKDVIITTYQTLNLEFTVKDPDVEEYEELDWLLQYGGLLAKMKWYRIVLDEAQFIRNRATRSSKTVARLRAKYRWMLTGTPVTNSLADIYGLIRFGHFRPWNDWESFDSYIARVQVEDPPLAGARAQEVLKPVMLRRTKNAQLEGKPLLTLPPKSIKIVPLEFSSDEREFYDSFEKRAKIRLGRFLRENTMLKKSQAEGYEDPSLLVGSESDKELGRAKRIMGAQWVDKVRKRALQQARAIELDFTDEGEDEDLTCPVCHDMFINDSGRVLQCGHEICFDCLLDISHSPIAHDGIFGYGNEKQNLQVEKEFEAAEAKGLRPCPTCKKMTDFSQQAVFKSSAFHPSEEEVREYARSERQRGKEAVKPEETSSSMQFSSLIDQVDTSAELVELSSDDEDEMPDLSTILKGGQGKGKGKEDAKRKREGGAEADDTILDITMGDITRDLPPFAVSASDDGDFLHQHTCNGQNGGESRSAPSESMVATWRRGDDDLEPSAKMLALIKLLKEADIYGDKTIVYSQWTSMLDLVETLFARYGIQSLRYDGKMSRDARDRALVSFKKAGGPKVILISTKSGGVGLNLVAANRVVNMDLSWNYAAESQAYDRVHRLGQEKDVFVKRLVVRDTIEERMLKLQDLKVGLSDAALGEGTGIKLHKMSVKEIKQLFGMTPVQKPNGENGENSQ